MSAIARAAAVDRTFLYRHRDLLEKIHALEAAPPPAGDAQARPSPAHPCRPTCSPRTNAPPGSSTRVQQLEKRLSEALGEQAWRESGLGTPADIDALNQTITHLEQQAIDLRLQLDERDQDLAAARGANRELMAQLNHATQQPVTRRASILAPHLSSSLKFHTSASELREREDQTSAARDDPREHTRSPPAARQEQVPQMPARGQDRGHLPGIQSARRRAGHDEPRAAGSGSACPWSHDAGTAYRSRG